MQYVYAALMLHSTGQKVTEDAVKKVVESTGAKADEAKIKALIASLEGVNIDEAIKQTAVAAPVAQAAAGEEKAEKKEKSPEEEAKSEEEAAGGLSSLFG